MNTKVNIHVKTFALTWLLSPLCLSLPFITSFPDLDMWDWMFPVLFLSGIAGVYLPVVPFRDRTPIIAREATCLSMFNAAFAMLVFSLGGIFSSTWESNRRAPELLEILGDCVVINENQALCHNNHWVCSRTSGECWGVEE